MANINQLQGKLFFHFRWQRKRYRKYTDLPYTPANRRRAEAALAQMERAIKPGTFLYHEYFPDSANARQPVVDSSVLTPLLQTPAATPSTPLIHAPLFRTFAATWFAEMQPQWRRSYRDNLRLTLDAHLIPRFGAQPLQQVTKSDILRFRADLSRPTEKRPNDLSASRINHILCLLKMILD